MLVCAIDTSGREGSVALAEADATSFQLLHQESIAGGTYSAQLIPTISRALSATGKQKSDIGLFAIASGPGSFTGLRVGISTVKALAEVLQVPVIAISVLEAIAFASGVKGSMTAVLDAQRDEVFVGEFECFESAISTKQELLLNWEQFASALRQVIVTPDASIASKLHSAGAKVHSIPRPTAEVYAQLSIRKHLAGESSPLDSLDANYIRRSDAEIFSAPKLGIKPKQP